MRPAAIKAGVIPEGESVRFGWHNLRHSLATFFGSKQVPVDMIRQMLRQKNDKMARHYIHRVNSQQVAAQGLFLDAIKLSGRPN